MDNLDVRWQQRFANYQKALAQLRDFLTISQINKFEKQGLIKSFEYTFELAWTVMKDYFTYEQANVKIMGSRDAIRTAFNRELITDGELWMDMIESRIASVHTYDENAADEVATKVIQIYLPLFEDFEQTMMRFL
jgi:nucleotidyltransferase substrate binding protein (TIGR01987 family)